MTDAGTGPYRHHTYPHLHSPFGDDRFGTLAERVARSFGTARFLTVQTVIVAVWVAGNVWLIPRLGAHPFDAYPFILLNLVFSTQAAYAAPFILVAQTRQALRDRAQTEAAARHAEELAATQTMLLARALDKLDVIERNQGRQLAEILDAVHFQPATKAAP